MKLNFLLLSAAAMVSAATATETDPTKNGVELLSAANYVILAKSGIDTVSNSAITGDIAVSPIAAEAMTGFSFTRDSGGEFSTSAQLTGKAFAANYASPIPSHLTTAVGAMEEAYTNASGRDNDDAARTNLGGGNLGGVFGGAVNPLTPGVYTFGSDVNLVSDIHLQGTGLGDDEGETDVFIVQITGSLVQAANYNVILTDGALAKNVFWQVAGQVTVGAGAHMKGVLLVKTDVLFKTGSILNGRVLSQTACNLQMATITEPPESQE
jgi:hypothetical protein